VERVVASEMAGVIKIFNVKLPQFQPEPATYNDFH
jgi:hypothetical protein